MKIKALPTKFITTKIKPKFYYILGCDQGHENEPKYGSLPNCRVVDSSSQLVVAIVCRAVAVRDLVWLLFPFQSVQYY
jgi:hypothetical protein